MASIFLSYARADAARARRIAEALEAAGHSVWWDRQLHAGARFTAEIGNALKTADFVMVLWSRASVESAWVHDEAAAGRDSGRLIPVLIDRVEPPLGFRQYHAISFGGAGRGATRTAALVSAVEARIAGKAASSGARTDEKRKLIRRLWLPATALLLLIAIGAGWWIYRYDSEAGRASIVVEAAGGADSPTAELIAPVITAALEQFDAGPIAALEIRPVGRGRRATYHAKIKLVEDERQVKLGISLDSHGDQLWSTTVEGPSEKQSDLNRQAAAELGAALTCELDLRQRPHDLTSEVRRLYLDGCARLADTSDERNDKAINALRQVTQQAPRFAPGWAHLALAEFQSIYAAPATEKSNIAWTAGRHSTTAMSLDRSLPEPYFVRALDGPWGPAYMPNALGIIEDGLRQGPDSALLLNARAQVLANLGRLAEALESAKRAVSLDPLSPSRFETYVLMLAYNGQPIIAGRELDRASETWPRSVVIARARYMFDLRYGDPANAMRLIDDGVVDAPEPALQSYLQARLHSTSANIEAALQAYRARNARSPGALIGYLQALGTFNRVDEAYRALAAAPPEAIADFYGNAEVLFRPYMRSIRADARFMGLAHRVGLLTFWRKSRVWPDFCRDPQLRYECQREAAKYPLEPPKL